MTLAELDTLYRRLGSKGPADLELARSASKLVQKPPSVPRSGPVDRTLTLWGHCPSKKNLWKRGGSGKMFLDTEVKDQIATLTTQVMFQWGQGGPVEHPELTVTFYVVYQRQDQDGMYTTILDCLQAGGVLINDNIAHNNGPKYLPSCVVVSEAGDERTEVSVRKREEEK